MNEPEMRQLLDGAAVARLATVADSGRPHLVPMVFVLVQDTIYSAVDGKSKSSTKLKRLANIASNSRVSVIVDHYEQDWQQLWWVRADGNGRILEVSENEAGAAIAALVAKYPQYRENPALTPRGQVVAIDVRSWHGWRAD